MFKFEMTQTGLSHLREGSVCQDAVHSAKRGTVCAICVCDGAGAREYRFTREGADAQSKALSRMMAQRFSEFLRLPDDVIALEFTLAIKEKLRELHQRFGIEDATAFASTVICAGFDALSGRFLVVHLGDGMAAAISDGKAKLLTHAKHAASRATQLTINVPQVILNTIKISRGNADSLVLSSDGAEGCLYSLEGGVSDSIPQMASDLRRLPDPHFRKNIEQAVECAGFEDDFSIGILSRGVPALDWNRAQSLRMRRIRKAMISYARCLDHGLTRQQAARRAGWGRKNRDEKIRQASDWHLA